MSKISILIFSAFLSISGIVNAQKKIAKFEDGSEIEYKIYSNDSNDRRRLKIAAQFSMDDPALSIGYYFPKYFYAEVGILGENKFQVDIMPILYSIELEKDKKIKLSSDVAVDYQKSYIVTEKIKKKYNFCPHISFGQSSSEYSLGNEIEFGGGFVKEMRINFGLKDWRVDSYKSWGAIVDMVYYTVPSDNSDKMSTRAYVFINSTFNKGWFGYHLKGGVEFNGSSPFFIDLGCFIALKGK